MKFKKIKGNNLKSKRGELSVQIVFSVVIVIISIMFLIALFSKNLTGFARELYCKTVFYVHSSIFIPKAFRQDPQFCKYETGFKTKTIEPIELMIDRFEDGSKIKELDFSNEKKQNITFNIKTKMIKQLILNFSSNKNMSFSLSICNKTKNIEIKENSEKQEKFNSEYFDECYLDKLIIELNSSSGLLVIKNPKLIYEDCMLEKQLVANIINCWQETKQGTYSKDIICLQLVVPKFCDDEKTSESSITRMLKEQELCHIIGNKDYGCGEEDNIDYELNVITSRTNIMLEYKADDKKIIVS
ncbi:MAG: hypothetical protein QXU20_01720 [Candidatus Woesearchaeota archaeon]